MRIRIEHTSWVIEAEQGTHPEITIYHQDQPKLLVRCSSGELYLLGQAIKVALSKTEAR